MNGTKIAYAFSAGLVAAVNPCGFALLPTYLAYFLGLNGSDAEAANSESGRGRDLGRALAVGATVTAGFVTVFTVMGLIWGSLAASIKGGLSWAGLVAGALLIVLGIALVRGFEPKLRIPGMRLGGRSRELGSMYLYGVSYAVASLSCALPIFAGILTTTMDNESVLSAAVVVGAYGVGMGVLVTALTVATALARDGLVRWLRRVVPYISRISGALLIVGGLFVMWYSLAEIRVRDTLQSSSAFDSVTSWQGRIQDWMSSHQALVGWGAAAVVAVSAAVVAWRRWANRRDGTPTDRVVAATTAGPTDTSDEGVGAHP